MSTRSGGQAQITLTEEEGLWVAEHAETGVASQREAPQEASEMLLEAVALHRGEAGDGVEPPEEEREVLADRGLDHPAGHDVSCSGYGDKTCSLLDGPR